jgi:hypothetical protein
MCSLFWQEWGFRGVSAEEDCSAWRDMNIFWVPEDGGSGHLHLFVHLVDLPKHDLVSEQTIGGETRSRRSSEHETCRESIRRKCYCSISTLPHLKKNRRVHNNLLPNDPTDTPKTTLTLPHLLRNCDDIAPYTEHTTPSTSIHSYFNHVSPPPQTNASHLPKPPPCTQWKIRSILRERDWPEFFCLQEVKIPASQRSRLKTAKDAANDSKDGGPEYTIYCNLAVRAKRPVQNRRMYGVITYIRSDVAEHVRVARG